MSRTRARTPTPEGSRPGTEPHPRLGEHRKKLLFVFGSLERAGAQLRTLEVCDALRRQGCAIDFDFCSVDLGPNELEAQVRRLGGSTCLVSMRSARFPFRFWRLLREGRYDVINTEPQLLSGIVIWLAALQRVPVRIVTIHNSTGDPGQSARSRLVRLVLSNRLFVRAMRTLMTRYSTNVIAVSRSALDSVLPGRWQSACDCRILYNGTDPVPLLGPVDAGSVREEFGWPSDSRIVVNVGRLSAQKNHTTILETTRLVYEQDPMVRLLLIGGGVLRDEVDRRIDRLGIRSICALTSDRTDVARLLLASDVFFFPSLWEGLPGAPLEALAAGLPLVASDIPALQEIATYFPGSVLMAPANDIRRHALHIRRTLQAPKDRAGLQRRFATTPFTLGRSVSAYRSIYKIDERHDRTDGAGSPADKVRGERPPMSGSIAPKVLYTSADADRQGGALRCLFDMASEIVDWGYRPVLALSETHIDPMLKGKNGSPRIYTLPLPRPHRGSSIGAYLGDIFETIRSAWRLAAIIRREEISLVHVNEILDVYGGIAARLAGVPCVWHVRADISAWPFPLRILLPRMVAGLSSEIIAVSDSVREEVFRQRGIDTPKVSVVHDPGPDPAAFRPGVDGAPVRQELGLADDAPLVVLVAKMVEPKGHAVLIRAIPRVLGAFPKAHFVIVGGDLEGIHHRRYAERLRRLPADLGIEGAVTFTGFRSDIPQIMAAASLITHCSTHPDPFPGVVLQGMALGKAVIASDIGGPREQIEDGSSGILVPPNDPGALASAICALLYDPNRRASIGRRAACQVRDRFTSDRFYRRLSDGYGDLIRSAPL